MGGRTNFPVIGCHVQNPQTLNEWKTGAMNALANGTARVKTAELIRDRSVHTDGRCFARQHISRLFVLVAGSVVFSLQTNRSRVGMKPSQGRLFSAISAPHQSAIAVFVYVQTRRVKAETPPCARTADSSPSRCVNTSIFSLQPLYEDKKRPYK